MNYNQGGQPAAESQQIHVRSESSQLESSDETVAKSGEEQGARRKEKAEIRRKRRTVRRFMAVRSRLVRCDMVSDSLYTRRLWGRESLNDQTLFFPIFHGSIL